MTSPAGRRLRAIVFGGGMGMFPPLMQKFREEFEIVAVLGVSIPTIYSLFHRALTVRLPRHAWYRAWRYYEEKTPTVFRLRTRDASRQLRRYEGKFDVILAFGATFAPGIGLDKPLFVFTDSCRWLSAHNVHDEISHFRNPRHESEWYSLEKDVYVAAARVFVGSNFVRNALLARYGVAPECAVVSGFGAGLGFGDPYHKTFDGKTILYIGKGDFEKKGGTLLMRAFERVRAKHPGARLHIVGQDRLPPSEDVVNHGFVRDRERLVQLMRSAHVFALPSLVDRNPISILEAMAAATPCVSSDYGAIPELVGDAGIITPCGDVDALASALLKVLRDNSLARTLGERGRLRFEQTYNWDRAWEVVAGEFRAVLH